MTERQSQKAGENSKQIQVLGDYHVHEGVTEQRATEIAQQTAKDVLASCHEEARTSGASRIDQLDQRVIPKLDEKDLLGVFRDPGFQVLLKKAQIGAASTDRPADYDMLANLLADRAERGESRPIRASIDKAVEVVDLLDAEALNGLTITQAFIQYAPLSGEIDAGLDALEALFSQLLGGTLPTGGDWIDHLDTLGAIRDSSGIMTRNPALEVWTSKMSGYVSQGVSEETADTALSQFRARVPNLRLIELQDHELKPGWKRFPLVSLSTFQNLLARTGVQSEFDPEATSAALQDLFAVDVRDQSLDGPFIERINLRPSLRLITEWWDSIPSYFSITGVGRTLARANAERLDHLKMLPPLD